MMNHWVKNDTDTMRIGVEMKSPLGIDTSLKLEPEYPRQGLLPNLITDFGNSLCVGDVINSNKRYSNPIEYVGHKSIYTYQKHLYPGFPDAWSMNHTRMVLGKFRPAGCSPDREFTLVFEWASPTARISYLQGWMLCPSYARIYRNDKIHTYAKTNPEVAYDVLETAMSHSGKLYDYVQLLGIGLGLKWLQLGERYEVCSSGVREILEKHFPFVAPLFPNLEVWQTPPAAFACHPETWSEVSYNGANGHV